MQKIFALTYRPGPSWIPDTSVFEQPLGAHREYMRSLHEAGIVLLGGPYRDDTGGFVAVKADSREHAVAILLADPAIEAGVMLGDVHPWLIVAWRAESYADYSTL